VSTAFTESVVEEAALEWLAALQYGVLHGPDIAPGELLAERKDYGQVILEDRLRQALARLNPKLPAEALEDAFRKIVRMEGSTAEARNRAFHRMLVDGVTVEYRRPDGSIAGAQVRVLDFARTEKTDRNDWLAVHQFAVAENKHVRRPDVVLFVNGLLPTLFDYNALVVISDGTEARIGTLTAGREWFKPWRTIAGETSPAARQATAGSAWCVAHAGLGQELDDGGLHEPQDLLRALQGDHGVAAALAPQR